jgi:hypothetical protein
MEPPAAPASRARFPGERSVAGCFRANEARLSGIDASPFGFEPGPDGRLYVSEAPTSSASSYDVAFDGAIDP